MRSEGRTVRSSRTRVRGRSISVAPSMLRNAGRMNSSKPTRADTGLPGKLKTRVSPEVAKLNGFPGFMNTRRKWTWASSESSGLTRSRSPMDTPPLVMTTSLVAIRSMSDDLRAAASSGPRPAQIISAPASCSAAIRLKRFASRIWPGPGISLGSTNSFPVDKTLTLGRRTTSTGSTPKLQHRGSFCQIHADRSNVLTRCDMILVDDHMFVGKLGRLDRDHRGRSGWNGRSGGDPGGGADTHFEVSNVTCRLPSDDFSPR